MASAATPKPKAPTKKRATRKVAPPRAEPAPADPGLVEQMRSMAGKMLGIGVATVGAAKTLHGAASMARALRRMRESAGLTIDEVGAAIDLKDPALIEAWENGRIAVPFELLLRLAAVLGRNDPVGFIVKFTRGSNPELWRSLEQLGIGKLVIQSAREREFANIYRADDAARELTDQEFAAVLEFMRSAFAMAMTLQRRPAERGET